MAKQKTNIQQFRCGSVPELHKAFNEIKSTVAGDTKFMAQALLFIAEALAPKDKPKRTSKISEWNKFFAQGMKAGQSPKEIGAAWKRRTAR